MDWDEDHLGDAVFDENAEICIYCGESLQPLNVVHYEINVDTLETKILAVNPMPHDKFMNNLREGFIHRIELVCNDCLKEDFDM